MFQRITRQQTFTVCVLALLVAHWSVNRLPLADADFAETALLLDLGITLPLLYALLCRPPGIKAFLQKTAGLLLLGLAAGSWILPATSKHLWHTIDRYRTLGPALAVIFEFSLLLFLTWRLRRWLARDAVADRALHGAVQRVFGDGAGAALVLFEVRMWYYALFLRRAPQYAGEQHFHYARNDGNASNQLAFLLVMLFEMPLAHLLLHFIWSPAAAWVATLLSAWGMVFLWAEYRATLLRPVSLDRDCLHLRCGVTHADASIPYDDVVAVALVAHPQRRQRGKHYYRQMGRLNVEITLREGTMLPTLFGQRAASHALLGLDQPAAFVTALRARLT